MTEAQDGAPGGSEQSQLSWATCRRGLLQINLASVPASELFLSLPEPSSCTPQLTPAPFRLTQGHQKFSLTLRTVPTEDLLSWAPVTPSAYCVAPWCRDFLFPETPS